MNCPVPSVPILLNRSTVPDAEPPIDTPLPELPEIVLPPAYRVLGRTGEAHRRPDGVDDVDAVAAVVQDVLGVGAGKVRPDQRIDDRVVEGGRARDQHARVRVARDQVLEDRGRSDCVARTSRGSPPRRRCSGPRFRPRMSLPMYEFSTRLSLAPSSIITPTPALPEIRSTRRPWPVDRYRRSCWPSSRRSRCP